MAEKNEQTNERVSRRNTKIGQVTSTRMAKTIVVRVNSQKSHPLYKRVVKTSKKFYAHDEDGAARVGDFVEIEETRPLSRLKRWKLKNVIQRAALVPETTVAENQPGQ